MKEIILIGYSGHAFVIYGIFRSGGHEVKSYCDKEEKRFNPFSLNYLGSENDEKVLPLLKSNDFFISVGDNQVRNKIYADLSLHNLIPVNAIHPSAIIDHSCLINGHGIMISAGVCINPLAKIGTGVVCNTGSVIEHECVVNDFAHIAPSAVLCGNVRVGENSFVGAGSVVRENITIGKNVIIGAGSVVVKNIPDNMKVAGNPARIL